ncbi:MAG: UTP--glucose-1-phosphate uridylyltransferase [Phycisphaerae bacterium]|nr:UTP--glucose-1-phosphate uridylyltransferase [Phycisphaerae bacterium]
MKIKKAVIAVAGYGTRFLPAVKVVPKELLPILDKPIVQYLVEEAVDAGIEDIVLVTRSGTGLIADHFDSSRALEVHLAEQNKPDYLAMIQALPKMANFCQIRQGRHLPYGNGTPLLAAKDFLGDEPFAYMFGDDVVFSETPCIKQLIDVYLKHQPAAVVAFQEVPPAEISRYGSALLKPGTEPKELEHIIEKAPHDKAPSLLAQLGRFVLSPRIIEILERRELGLGNELYLTDAIDKLCREACVIAHPIEGEWHTTGDPLRFLITNIECALRRPDMAKPLAAYLRKLDLSKH